MNKFPVIFLKTKANTHLFYILCFFYIFYSPWHMYNWWYDWLASRIISDEHASLPRMWPHSMDHCLTSGLIPCIIASHMASFHTSLPHTRLHSMYHYLTHDLIPCITASHLAFYASLPHISHSMHHYLIPPHSMHHCLTSDFIPCITATQHASLPHNWPYSMHHCLTTGLISVA